MVCQNKGLDDMTQGCCDGLAPNLLAIAKSASTDSGSKSHEHVCVSLPGSSDEEGVEVEASTPRKPNFSNWLCVLCSPLLHRQLYREELRSRETSSRQPGDNLPHGHLLKFGERKDIVERG